MGRFLLLLDGFQVFLLQDMGVLLSYLEYVLLEDEKLIPDNYGFENGKVKGGLLSLASWE